MILLHNFNSRLDAELAQSLLASEGIETLIQADDMGGYRPYLSLISGANLMLLDHTKLEDAVELLKSFKS